MTVTWSQRSVIIRSGTPMLSYKISLTFKRQILLLLSFFRFYTCKIMESFMCHATMWRIIKVLQRLWKEVVRAPKYAGFWSEVENISKKFIGSDVSGLGQPRASCSIEQVVRRQWGRWPSHLYCTQQILSSLALCFQVAEGFWEPAPIVNQRDVMNPSEWVSLGNGGFAWF